MEKENRYYPEETSENKDTQEAKSILDATLSGKTEAELTPEQLEAEREFELKNLDSFLEQIDKEKVMVHGTGARMKIILDTGVRSIAQREGITDPELRDKRKGGDPQFQRLTTSFLIDHVIGPYGEFLLQNHTNEEIAEKKEEILSTVPQVGRKRVEWFLDNTVPKFIKAGLDPSRIDPAFGGLDTEGWAYHGDLVTDKGMENFFRFRQKLDNESDAQYEENRNTAMWGSLVSLIGGIDLISATPAKFLKQQFGREPYRRGTDLYRRVLLRYYGPVAIYFEAPHELRTYNLDHASFTNNNTREWDEETAHDIGVSNRITPNHFKAICFGDYDRDNRILYLPPNVHVDDVTDLTKLQDKGVRFFDSNHIPLPPLESIQFQSVGYKSEDWPFLEEGTPEGKRIKDIEKKNNSYSYETISKIIKEKGYKWGQSDEHE